MLERKKRQFQVKIMIIDIVNTCFVYIERDKNAAIIDVCVCGQFVCRFMMLGVYNFSSSLSLSLSLSRYCLVGDDCDLVVIQCDNIYTTVCHQF